MDLLTILFLAFAMCMMLSSVVAGGYALLNKPQATESQPLLSADDLDKLAGKLDEAGNAVQYSNVLDARIGFDSGSGVIKSSTLPPPDCQTLCIGTANCEGFQISGQNSCDLLANVTSTYAFVETGYNVFTLPIKVPPDAFGTARQGEISGKDVARAPSAGPAPPEVFTKHECAKRCHDTPGCKSFSVSSTLGCRPKSALNFGDASVYASGDWNSYFKETVKHSTGWSWVPAPSPSPA
jgi:hypothetical protein